MPLVVHMAFNHFLDTNMAKFSHLRERLILPITHNTFDLNFDLEACSKTAQLSVADPELRSGGWTKLIGKLGAQPRGWIWENMFPSQSEGGLGASPEKKILKSQILNGDFWNHFHE